VFLHEYGFAVGRPKSLELVSLLSVKGWRVISQLQRAGWHRSDVEVWNSSAATKVSGGYLRRGSSEAMVGRRVAVPLILRIFFPMIAAVFVAAGPYLNRFVGGVMLRRRVLNRVFQALQPFWCSCNFKNSRSAAAAKVSWPLKNDSGSFGSAALRLRMTTPESLKHTRRKTALVLTFLLAGALAAMAQTASISGTVHDSSEAAITQAQVHAKNLATQSERVALTNDAGFYRIDDLAPGTYSVSVERDGFKGVTLDSITLTVDQKFTFNTTLEVGDVLVKVEVNSSMVPTVDTETSTLSNVINHEQMTELPLILRDPYQLVLLTPGVTQSDSNEGGVSVNGGRERNNSFLLDGADNNDTEVPGILGGITAQNPDSTQEFRVMTNNFAPEYGRNNGAIIDVITRSSTNQFHGDVYYFGRWDALGARDYFNHQIDPETGKVAPKDPYVRNLYGASVGGPIIKDKTFFFVNYEGKRFVTTVTNTSVVPTEAFKSGMFTYTNPATGATQTLDVTTPNTINGNNATGVGLDSITQRILALYPKPNVNNPDGVTGELFFPSESREKDEDGTVKIDHSLTKNNNVSARYIYNWFNDPNPFHMDFLPGGLGALSSHQRTQGLALSLISTPSGNLSNEVRFGANRTNLFFGCVGISTFDSFGFVDPQGRGADYALPGISGAGGNGNFGCFQESNSNSRKTGTYQVLDNLTKVVKSHTLKVGGEYRRVYSNNYTDFASRQLFTFDVFTGSQIDTLQNLNTGVKSNDIEDMVGALLGLVNYQTQTQFFNAAGAQLVNDNLGFRQRELGIFAQDVWKVRSNLSLTYGLRWEYYGVPFEQHNSLSNLFQNSSGPAPALDPSIPECGGFTPCNGFTFSPVGPGTGHQLYNDYYRNFEPRVGFAWDPFRNGRTSVRGGIGVFSDRIYGNLISDARGNPPYQPSYLNFTTFFNGAGPDSQLQNQAVVPTLTPSPIVLDGSGIFPDLFDPRIKPPRVVTWNFGVQRQLGNLTVEANYVGNHGTRILRVIDGNLPQPDLVAANLANGTPPGLLQYGSLFFGGPGITSVNNNAFFDTFTDQTTGSSTYHGLQLQAQERNFHGLQLAAAYTWSHAIDDSSDPLAPTRHNGNYPVNSFDLLRERGNSGFDTRHRASINFVYQPAIGRGRAHLSQGFAGRALEGWEISGIAAFQTGLPYDIFGPLDTLHTNGADRAAIVNSSVLKAIPATGKVLAGGGGVFTGFNAAAFNPEDGISMPIPWGIPSSSLRNSFYGPGVNNWNINLAKTTKLTERMNFQLRFEVYNVFNRVQFGKPDNQIADSTFGYSTTQVGQNDGTTGARQIQIGAKLNF
jgi:hypothetical protein